LLRRQLPKRDEQHEGNNFPHKTEFMRISQLIRPLVRELHPYIYGGQPKIKRLIKLNTNENPYPPSPRVVWQPCFS
jgi:hypothetical protein